MKYLKKFIKFIKEAATAELPRAASETEVKPGQPITKPRIPTKPKRKEDKEGIQQPTVDPRRKAVTEMDVVNRFIDEMNKKGESIKKYM